MRRIVLLLALALCLNLCHAQEVRVMPADELTDVYVPLLKGSRVALYSNHTAMVGEQHVIDILLAEGVNVTAIFSPEHGFRGTADAGEHVSSTVDAKTGVPILSLYDGRSGRPSEASISKFDVLVVDIQDVGLRFYTYYITMCKLIEACAAKDKEVVILDRPNPNGHYVDGPTLDMKYKSGVGWLPIPIVHGMTLGELAQMAVGEHWLQGTDRCRLTVVRCRNYTHSTPYELPIPPSPNLPNMKSVYLYPSTCLFEGTIVSLGRGTDKPFQIYGHPQMSGCTYTFTPRSMAGAKDPPLKDQLCHGVDLTLLSDSAIRQQGIRLDYVIDAYHKMGVGERFFQSFFDKLTGVAYVKEMIIAGKSANEIAARWKNDVETFKAQRRRYLLYPE